MSAAVLDQGILSAVMAMRKRFSWPPGGPPRFPGALRPMTQEWELMRMDADDAHGPAFLWTTADGQGSRFRK